MRITTETNLNKDSFKASTSLSRLQYLWPKSTTKGWKRFLKYNHVCREGCRKQFIANEGEGSQGKHYKMQILLHPKHSSGGQLVHIFCNYLLYSNFLKEVPQTECSVFLGTVDSGKQKQQIFQ